LTPVELPYQPAGFVVAPGGGGSVILYDRNAQGISQFAAPDFFGDRSGFSHLVGSTSAELAQYELVYFSFADSSIMVTNLEGTRTLLDVENFFTMTGIPGDPFMAFTTLEYAESGLRSLLTVGEMNDLPTAAVALTVLDTDGFAVRPLAIEENNHEPVGFYYTSVPYGIGGDIVFEPRRALQYFDLTTFQTRQVLGIGTSPSGLSPDLTWLAYTSEDVSPLILAQFSSRGTPLTIPLLDGSDRGAGAAVFSPDNRYVAWKEGSGWSMSETPNFHATIRIATTNGEITAEIPDTLLAELVGGITYPWIEPVGWLDGETLLIGLRGDNWEDAYLLRVNPVGSDLALLVTGSFVSFIYP